MKFGQPGRNSNRPTIACNGQLSAAGDPRRVLAGQGARMNMQNAVVLEWTYTPDGRRDVTIFVDSCLAKMTTCGRVDLVTTDPEGKVVRDTKRERIDSEKGIAQSIAQIAPTDPLLAKLLKSFRIAVEDPTDELVHLYEIRDALSSHFGSAKAVRAILA